MLAIAATIGMLANLMLSRRPLLGGVFALRRWAVRWLGLRGSTFGRRCFFVAVVNTPDPAFLLLADLDCVGEVVGVVGADLERTLGVADLDRADLALGDLADPANHRQQPAHVCVLVATDVEAEPDHLVAHLAARRTRSLSILPGARGAMRWCVVAAGANVGSLAGTVGRVTIGARGRRCVARFSRCTELWRVAAGDIADLGGLIAVGTIPARPVICGAIGCWPIIRGPVTIRLGAIRTISIRTFAAGAIRVAALAVVRALCALWTLRSADLLLTGRHRQARAMHPDQRGGNLLRRAAVQQRAAERQIFRRRQLVEDRHAHQPLLILLGDLAGRGNPAPRDFDA